MKFTCEQVSKGHPDKICDQISDAIVTECLRQDKTSRVAVETMIKSYSVIVAGEITTKAKYNPEDVIKNVLRDIGLDEVKNYKIVNLIETQSPDIAQGVDVGGAGDQGIMFGYATKETEEMLPISYVLATRVLQKLDALDHPQLKADAKAQVTFDYDRDEIDTFLVSVQHTEDITLKEIKEIVHKLMIETAKEYDHHAPFKMLVNPTGRFVKGSSFADAGLTGRKIIADSYGGMARHGGGAFSGKDPSKVDRSGAYIARKIAKEIIRKDWCYKCEIQIGYAIGVAEPVSVYVDTFGTEKVPVEQIEAFVATFDLRPQEVIDQLDLLNVDYNQVSAYGHFMNDKMPWEM